MLSSRDALASFFPRETGGKVRRNVWKIRFETVTGHRKKPKQSLRPVAWFLSRRRRDTNPSSPGRALHEEASKVVQACPHRISFAAQEPLVLREASASSSSQRGRERGKMYQRPQSQGNYSSYDAQDSYAPLPTYKGGRPDKSKSRRVSAKPTRPTREKTESDQETEGGLPSLDSIQGLTSSSFFQ